MKRRVDRCRRTSRPRPAELDHEPRDRVCGHHRKCESELGHHREKCVVGDDRERGVEHRDETGNANDHAWRRHRHAEEKAPEIDRRGQRGEALHARDIDDGMRRHPLHVVKHRGRRTEQHRARGRDVDDLECAHELFANRRVATRVNVDRVDRVEPPHDVGIVGIAGQ